MRNDHLQSGYPAISARAISDPSGETPREGPAFARVISQGELRRGKPRGGTHREGLFGSSSAWLTRLSCALCGHHVDNHVFERDHGAAKHCRCGEAYLAEDGSLTRVRHTLSCFLGHHTYKRLIDRHGHHEYVCVQCGHPLLFPADCDPWSNERQFAKKVRYLCGLFGHRVAVAAQRDGVIEYACHCGHSFLKSEDAGSKIHHPLRCVLLGHWVRFVTRRGGFAEYVCRTCGHPFCFADPRA